MTNKRNTQQDQEQPQRESADFVTPSPERKTLFSVDKVDLNAYDHIIVTMSGKDSIASLLKLIDDGVDLSRCEIWHHLVDGIGGDNFMDWIFMDDYMVKLAKAFGLPIYFSSLEHGFKGEMLKNNSVAHDHLIETPDGLMRLGRVQKPGTRMKFPQKSKSLLTRWCSGALKVDVGRRALTNQERFLGKKVLLVSGERREEGGGRRHYNQFEPSQVDARRSKKKRLVDHYRPVLSFTEKDVWAMLEKHRVEAPVPYKLGLPRCSCRFCIFGSEATWATLNKYWPDGVREIQYYENKLDCTISRDRIDVIDVGARAKAWTIKDKQALEQSTKREYELPIFTPAGKDWELPQGAYSKEAAGAS